MADWKPGFCPHQYHRNEDGTTDCPACAREAMTQAATMTEQAARAISEAGGAANWEHALEVANAVLATLQGSAALPSEAMDAWNPGNEDPYWMLEVRQGYDGAGQWLKNDRTCSTTLDPLKALRYPHYSDADSAKSRLPMSDSHRFEPTEHAWIQRAATPTAPVQDDDAEIERIYELAWSTAVPGETSSETMKRAIEIALSRVKAEPDDSSTAWKTSWSATTRRSRREPPSTTPRR